MARVRERVRIPLATNMCIIDLDSAAEGLTLGSADVILGDIFEWGGIAAMLKLKGACEIFQVNLNYHSAGELGIATAAYLHVAAATPALPHALDTHATELAGDVVKPGVIGLTSAGNHAGAGRAGPWRRARSGSVRGGGRGAPSGWRPIASMPRTCRAAASFRSSRCGEGRACGSGQSKPSR